MFIEQMALQKCYRN